MAYAYANLLCGNSDGWQKGFTNVPPRVPRHSAAIKALFIVYVLGSAFGRGGLEDTSSSYRNTDIRHVNGLESAKHSRSGNGGHLPTLGVTSILSCFSCSLWPKT